ncbi:MAG: DUF934 domain-containing protein [Pseudomonadota bacterium]
MVLSDTVAGEAVLIDRSGVIAERWSLAPDEGPLPEGPVILPFLRRDEIAELAADRPGAVGLHLPNDTDPRRLRDHFDGLALISVAFPSFADGRGFSIGRCLREIGYDGRLRATGPVIADQFAYLIECGFDEVSIPAALASRQPPERWLERLETLGLTYQRGPGGALRASILDQRRAARAVVGEL